MEKVRMNTITLTCPKCGRVFTLTPDAGCDADMAARLARLSVCNGVRRAVKAPHSQS